MLKYETLAAEITCLGGLLHSGKSNRSNILIEPVVLDLIQIMRHPQTDPILLTAICTFALDLFRCEELRTSALEMAPYYEKMSNMKYMIPYLGFEMYPKLLQMTRRYHQASSQSKKVAQPDDGWADQDGENGQAEFMMMDMGGGKGDGQGATRGGATSGGAEAGKQGL